MIFCNFGRDWHEDACINIIRREDSLIGMIGMGYDGLVTSLYVVRKYLEFGLVADAPWDLDFNGDGCEWKHKGLFRGLPS